MGKNSYPTLQNLRSSFLQPGKNDAASATDADTRCRPYITWLDIEGPLPVGPINLKNLI